MNDADAADTTTTTDAPPLLPKAAEKTAPEPLQASGRTLRASTLAARSAALAKSLVSPPPPPPPRRALKKKESTDETVESAADAAQPASLLQQPKLPVVKRQRRTKTGWQRQDGKSKEEKAAYRFLRTSDDEFRRLYRLYLARVEGELTLDEETKLLVEGLFGAFKELHGALAEVDEVHPTDERLANITKCALHLSQAAKAVASNEMTSCYFVEVISVLSGASLRGYSPAKALAEFDKHLDVVTKKRENREAYLIKTAEGGRGGRDPKGRDIFVDGETTRTTRAATNAREAATRAGKRERRYAGPTMETHALAAKAAADEKKRRNKNLGRRVKGAQKAQAVATPKDCTLAQTLGGVPLFVTQSRLVPEGADNRPRIAEEAAARAVQHRAEKGVKTMAEKAADRRARLPDNVYPSKALCRAGQFRIQVRVPVRGHGGKKKAMSVAEPGTDGYYASTKDAADVLEEWIKKERPREWLVPARK